MLRVPGILSFVAVPQQAVVLGITCCAKEDIIPHSLQPRCHGHVGRTKKTFYTRAWLFESNIGIHFHFGFLFGNQLYVAAGFLFVCLF